MKGVTLGYCGKEKKGHERWVKNSYFKNCLCNLNDEVSFALGLASLVCWGVSLVPQIITNFKNKSAQGISLPFLLTWLLGDIFNLTGCLLEPLTLPTQFYTALLYTTVTALLVSQCIYYDKVLPWWIYRNIRAEDESKPLLPKSHVPITEVGRSVPVEVPITAGGRESSFGDETHKQPFTHALAGCGTFLVASATLPSTTSASTVAQVKFPGRKLLLEKGLDNGSLGQSLGWLMAAIYISSPIPQICLNIKRGTVEGLNPLMSVICLLAEATYTASILAGSREWEAIKAHMPWLLDSIANFGIHFIIILQHIYYRYFKTNPELVLQPGSK